MNTMIPLERLSIAILVGVLGVCAGCAAEPNTHAHGEATLRLALVPQRVNAVVRRQARQLLYLETERQSFVTTPEHPFATVDSGWVRAGELAPGDQVISAKFGSLRVSSVRIETRPQPVPVFNLRVERAHAYWVGNADVLVHNTGCGASKDTIAQKAREVEEIQRKLAELEKGEASSSSEQPFDRQKKIEALKDDLKKARQKLYHARHNAKDKTQPREDGIASNSRKIQEAKRDLEALEKTEPTSSEHALELKREIAELKSKLDKLNNALYNARHRQRLKAQPELINPGGSGSSGSTKPGRSRLPGEDNIASKSREIEKAKRDLEALEKTEPTSSEHALELKKEIAELKSQLEKLNNALKNARYTQKRKLHPELIEHSRNEILRGDALKKTLAAAQAEFRELRRRRTDSHDPAAPRDPREAELPRLIRKLMYDERKEEELRELKNRLAELEKVVPTPDAPYPGLAAEKETLKDRIQKNQSAARVRRSKHPERAKAREDNRANTAPSAEPASPVDQDSTDQLLSEMSNEQAAREEQLERETLDVDEETQLINELLASIPSPSPEEVSEAVARLRRELQEERARFNENNFALVNEYAFLSSTLGQDNPAAVRRMAEIQAKIKELQQAWQKSTQERLDEIRRLLRDMQRLPSLRDEAIEAELAEQIALLEDELAHPPF